MNMYGELSFENPSIMYTMEEQEIYEDGYIGRCKSAGYQEANNGITICANTFHLNDDERDVYMVGFEEGYTKGLSFVKNHLTLLSFYEII